MGSRSVLTEATSRIAGTVSLEVRPWLSLYYSFLSPFAACCSSPHQIGLRSLRRDLEKRIAEHTSQPNESWDFPRNKSDTLCLVRRLLADQLGLGCPHEDCLPTSPLLETLGTSSTFSGENTGNEVQLNSSNLNTTIELDKSVGASGFGALPPELMFLIFKHLSADDLSRCARVCWWWNAAARDPNHWRRVCRLTWPHESTKEMIRKLCSLQSPYRSWLQMYIRRPRLRYDGAYCLRYQYVRVAGDNHNRSVALVYYYRLIRFFEDGFVSTLTTASKPEVAVKGLTRWWDGDIERVPSIGRAYLDEDSLTVGLEVPLYHPKYPLMQQGLNCMEFSLSQTHEGARNRLWLNRHYGLLEHGDESLSYELPEKPFKFVPFATFKTTLYELYPDEQKTFLKRTADAKPHKPNRRKAG